MNDEARLSAIEFEPMNRSALLMRGVLAACAAYGTYAAAPVLRHAFAQQPDASKGDIDILNFALTLEYLEATFYERALELVPSLDKETKELVEEIGAHEADHVDALIEAIKGLGAKPVEAPTVDFADGFSSPDSFLALAMVFEDTGVSAYNGAAPKIKSKELLASAGTIVQIEARHAAAIRMLIDEDPAPEGFDVPLPMDEVLQAVTPFIR